MPSAIAGNSPLNAATNQPIAFISLPSGACLCVRMLLIVCRRIVVNGRTVLAHAEASYESVDSADAPSAQSEINESRARSFTRTSCEPRRSPSNLRRFYRTRRAKCEYRQYRAPCSRFACGRNRFAADAGAIASRCILTITKDCRQPTAAKFDKKRSQFASDSYRFVDPITSLVGAFRWMTVRDPVRIATALSLELM